MASRDTRAIRVERTPKKLRQRGQTDKRKARHVKAKRIEQDMHRVGRDGVERVREVLWHEGDKGRLCGVSVYTTKYPGGLYYGPNSLVPVL